MGKNAFCILTTIHPTFFFFTCDAPAAAALAAQQRIKATAAPSEGSSGRDSRGVPVNKGCSSALNARMRRALACSCERCAKEHEHWEEEEEQQQQRRRRWSNQNMQRQICWYKSNPNSVLKLSTIRCPRLWHNYWPSFVYADRSQTH